MSSRRENAVETDNEKHNKYLLKISAEHLVKHLKKSLEESAGHVQLRAEIKNACHENRDWIVASCQCKHGIGSLVPRGRAPPGCKHVVIKLLQEASLYLDQMTYDIQIDARESRELARAWYRDATMQLGDVPKADLAVGPADIPEESEEASVCFDEERNCNLLQQAAMRIVLHIPSALQREMRQKKLTKSLELAFSMSERLRVPCCGC